MRKSEQRKLKYPIPFQEAIHDEMTFSEISKLLALQRAGLLIVDGLKQHIYVESGVYYLTPEPFYFYNCKEVITRSRLRSLLNSL